MKRLVIELPDETHQMLKEFAVTRKSSMRIVMLALIADFLGTLKKGKKQCSAPTVTANAKVRR